MRMSVWKLELYYVIVLHDLLRGARDNKLDRPAPESELSFKDNFSRKGNSPRKGIDPVRKLSLKFIDPETLQ